MGCRIDSLLIVLPIFALVLAGWASRKLGALGPHAVTELNRFVVYLALPALLFDIIVDANWSEAWHPAFAAAFGISVVVVFVGTIIVARRNGRSLADAAIEGLNASYPNTGFMGFPLALAVFGRQSLPLTLIATILTACVLFGIAIALIERDSNAGQGAGQIGLTLVISLARNPLIAAPLLGALVACTVGTIPGPVDAFLKLLGAAASPCALIALGLFLAEPQAGNAGRDRTPWYLAAIKLGLQPAIALGAAAALRLPQPLLAVVVLMAALPTGTGPFMLAELYQREAGATARTILITTVLSTATVPAVVKWMGY